MLRNNGGDDLALASGATSFAFPTALQEGADYAVTVHAQPAGPSQTCTVSNGAGKVSAANVAGVVVTCTTNKYTLGGTASGVAGSGLVLHLGSGEDLPIAADGAFAFPTPLPSGSSYTVTVASQPVSPTQACSVAGGDGTIGGADVTSVAVTCVTASFHVSGAVAGLAGAGLVLRNNGGDDVFVAAGATSFVFPLSVASGGAYAVAIAAQPQTPSQTCSVAGGAGTIGDGDVTTVAVTCTTNVYAVSGTVSGLAGSGLVLQQSGEPLAITGNGAFTFPTPVASGAGYAVSVAAQPQSPWQTCTVVGASGTVGGGAVTDVAVTCTTNTYVIGGTISGLAGSGLVLRSGTGEELAVTANGSYAFLVPVASGATYTVSVGAQPTSPPQICLVAGGSGTVAGAPVTSVAVTCQTRYQISANVTGLAGAGLVLQNNGHDDLSFTSSGTKPFASLLDSGGTYAVSVLTQPTSPWQTCTPAAASGTVTSANVTVNVPCTTNTYTVSGTVSGLSGTGLVLQDNLGDDLAVSADGTFTFSTKVASGSAYAISVLSQPQSPWQTCTVASGSGTIAGAPITNVAVTCTTNTYAIGGTLTGLSGTGLVLRNSTGEELSPTQNGDFAFLVPVASGGAYTVSVKTQPVLPEQVCTVVGPSGTVGGTPVTSVAVTCRTRYQISANVTGLAGTGLVLQNNGGDNLSFTSSATKPFATLVTDGDPYAVTVLTQPTSPWQTCTPSSGSGTVAGANVTVNVPCTTNTYPVGGTVTGLTGVGLVLQNNLGDDHTIAGNGDFTFPTAVSSGAAYSVTVKTQPSGQVCTVAGGAGTVEGGAVLTVLVSCSSAVVQRWNAPTAWGTAWADSATMLQHAYFDAGGILSVQGPTFAWSGATPPTPRAFEGFPTTRYAGGPFPSDHYVATSGDSSLDLAGNMIVCAVVKPDYDPTMMGDGFEKPIVAKGVGTSMNSIPHGGWVLMQMHSQFCFHYQYLDAGGVTHQTMVYTPTFFADRGVPDAGPLNPSFVVICAGRDGDTLRIAANSYHARTASGTAYDSVSLDLGAGSVLDAAVAHRATIGGYDPPDPNHVFGGRVFETAVWSDAATEANLQARFAAFNGLFAAPNSAAPRYTRNREGPYGATEATYHATFRDGPRVDPTMGMLFGLQGWNRVSTSIANPGFANLAVATGEDLTLSQWTASGGATAANDGAVVPPGDSEKPSATRVTLPPGASLSIALQPFERAGAIHGQIWVRPVTTSGTLRVRTTQADPAAIVPSQVDLDLSTLPTGWSRTWLKGLSTDGVQATPGTLYLEAPAGNAGDITFYAWGIDLTQIGGGADLGAFDPGPAMYDWLPGDVAFTDYYPDARHPIDVLELPQVPGSTASTGFCVSVTARPPPGMPWNAPFYDYRFPLAWRSASGTSLQLMVRGSSAGPGNAGSLCFRVDDAVHAPTLVCTGGPASSLPGFTAGTQHTIKGCVAPSGASSLWADDVKVGAAVGGPFTLTTPNLADGHLLVGNGGIPANLFDAQPWHGYVKSALACRFTTSTDAAEQAAAVAACQ